jgi:hypothetical protein
MQRSLSILTIVSILILVNVTPCFAIDTLIIAFGMGESIGDDWLELLNSNSSSLHMEIIRHEDVQAAHILAQNGFKISMVISQLRSAIPIENAHAIDLYYNHSLLKYVYRTIDQIFEVDPGEGLGLNPERIYQITLGDEESPPPEWHPSVLRHNESFHEETGYWIKLEGPNATSYELIRHWVAEKSVWVYNQLYNYAKNKWPHLIVNQAWLNDKVYPGLLSDSWSGGGYLTGGSNNPFALYFTSRFSKTHSPNTRVSAVNWGTQSWPIEWGDFLGGFEPMRIAAWTTYLSGADAIIWFDLHPYLGWGWQRNDTLGKRLYLYTQRLASELNKLPPLKSQPRVLVVQPVGDVELFFAAESFLLTEFDTTFEEFLAKTDMNLKKYDLIIFGDQGFHNETVGKLNDYVRSGGNLALIGDFGRPEGYEPHHAYLECARPRLLIEKEAWGTVWAGHTTLNVSTPNLLNFNMNHDAPSSHVGYLHTSNTSGNYHPIGDFYQIDENGTTTQSDGYPLILYHNSSNPSEGYVLYFGYDFVSRDPDWVWYNNEDLQYTRQVIREVLQAYGRNVLGLNDTITTPETENLLITQGLLDDRTILAGLSNFLQNWSYTYIPIERDVNYTLDLSRFGLTDGNYWVHSLDKNSSIGQFTSHNLQLTVPIHLEETNDTRLLLISKEKPTPDYWINIYPPIPTVEEVEGPSLLEFLEQRNYQAAESKNEFDASIVIMSAFGIIITGIVFQSKKQLRFSRYHNG